jgi:mRNA interferase YafQ
MRSIEETNAFRRDLRRVLSRSEHRNLRPLLTETVSLLRSDSLLPPRLRDHALSGEWTGFRDCHVKSDLVLIYLKIEDALRLVRLGTHSDLFGK